MAPSDWHYAKDNRQLGPVSSTELKQLAESGQLAADDLVWREGMAEWIAADKVKGLFDASAEEQPGVESPPVDSPPVQPRPDVPGFSRFVAPPAEPQSVGPRKHVFDILIELIRSQFPPQFVERSSTIFSQVGHWGLYVGMAALLVFCSVLGAKVGLLAIALGIGALGISVLIVLQYASGKFLVSLDTLNRSTSGRMSSTALPDCFALLSICAGPVLLVVMVLFALQLGDLSLILAAIGAFILCEYVAILSLSLETLNIKVDTDASAGEEAVGILSFLAKLILRLVPVVFGTGIVLGTCNLIIAAASDTPVWESAAMTGASVLFTSAAWPIIAYVCFLLAFLVVDVLHSILKLPRLLKQDEEEAEDEVGHEV